MPDRFYVIETRGYPAGGGRIASSFAVLDRLNAHREVARLYATEGGHATEDWRRARAHAKCGYLNDLERRRLLAKELERYQADAAAYVRSMPPRGG